jgi:hypothetical protein
LPRIWASGGNAMKALLLKFLQSKDVGRLVLVKNSDGSLTVEQHDAAGGVVAATAPAADVAALLAALGAA